MSKTHSDANEGTDYKDADTLRRLYWDEGLSTVDIADLAGVSSRTICDWMEDRGIPRQDRIQASKEKSRVGYADYRMDGSGYMELRSNSDGKKESVKVSRLLAVAEYGFEAVKGKHVHHENGIPWLDYADNIELLDPFDHLSMHSAGEQNPNAKLTDGEVIEIRRLYEDTNLSQSEVGEKFGVSQTTVYNIVNGHTHADPNA